jgi:copper chaperone CopZ
MSDTTIDLPVLGMTCAACVRRVERAISGGQTVYGVNTGFGKLANVRIAPDQLDQLQVNLIRSHAAGVGAPLDAAVVRAVMLLRANVLLRPTSGVRPELVEALLTLFTLEKAAYELCYEAANRPTWIGVPLAGLHELVGTLSPARRGKADIES